MEPSECWLTFGSCCGHKPTLVYLIVVSLFLQQMKCSGKGDFVSTEHERFHLEVESFTTESSDGVPSLPIISSCNAFINDFADAASNFTKCSILYARPLRFCEHCIEQYVEAKNSFDLIIQANAQDVSGAKCSDIVLNSDKIRIIEQTANFIDDIWNKCYCNDCFNYFKDDNGSTTFKVSNKTRHFFHLAHHTNECFKPFMNVTPIVPETNATLNSSVCVVCSEYYKEMNDYYDELVEKTVDSVCMDIVDVMNSTRLRWSKEFLCSKPHVDIVPVVLLSCFFSMLPVIFYVASKVHGTKSQRRLLKQRRLKDVTRASTSGSLQDSLAVRST